MLTKRDLENIGLVVDKLIDKRFIDFAIKMEEMINSKIESLAIMVARGFEEAKENTQRWIRESEERLSSRIDHIEFGLIREHSNRIERLEDNVRIIKTDLGL